MTARLSVRAKLTLVYGTLMLVVEAILLAVVYFLMTYVPVYRIAAADGPVGMPVPDDWQPPPGPWDAQPAGVIAISSKADVLTSLLWSFGVGLLLVTALGLLVCWLVAGRVLSPLARITAAAHTATTGTLHERIALPGRADELKKLADTFDGMLARLEREFAAHQRFAANAAHELRTPLAVTRTMLQVALAHPEDHDLRELGPKLLATNERSIATTEALLVLASAEHARVRTGPVDLAALAGEVVGQVAAEAAQREVSVAHRLPGCWVTGDPALLRQLLLNLVHNAVRHNHAGGQVAVGVLPAAAGGGTLTVSNTGPVVPQDELSFLFEPFYRRHGRAGRGGAAPGAVGHGLGLAIARAIAEAHGGRICVVAHHAGGLTVTVTL
ncbi:two-component sensor histidine kinase [Longispora fulva]|uniref:histidine kinase n=1 Tax=Longispora fulva TaxID=619741 RepID=A0A8J7KEN0_9ACTN|nr:HAMP domain-containing sensor histidine kinase [Longispora fulva]MBG6135180.1 signal transduction histidine kinase [Longispora fulva]GIG56585.1 two-component sensor histidine kinase [Longispora fulva]